MREEEETLIYYISPTNKIHSNQCRHFKADTDGWQKMSSYSEAISTGAKPCQICCSQISVSPIETTNKQQDLLTQPVTDFSKSSSQEDVKTSGKKNKRSIACSITSFNTTEKLKTTSTQQDLFTQPVTKQPQSSSQNDVKTSKKKSKNKKKTPAKRYKILAGNGCHQAISEVQGILVPPIDDESSYQLILPDGLALEATFSNPYLESLALKQPNILGVHWFRGYPKMQDTKLVSFQIVGWDGNMPTNEQGWERWEFIGLWTLQKNLTVQRSITARTVRKEARQTGFITEFKFTFSNTEDWIQEKKLWIGYVYKLLCCREEDTLKIQKVIPYACPRVKPVPKPKPVNKKSKHITLIENLQRVDLNPVEETEAVLELLSIQLNLGVEEIVSLLYRIRSDVLKEKSDHNVVIQKIESIFDSLGLLNWQSFVTHRLPLLNLPADILEILRQGKIAYTKAIALSKIKDEELREQLTQEAVEQKLSLRDLKTLISEMTKPEQQPEPQESKTIESVIKTTAKELTKTKLWKSNPQKWKKVEKLIKEINMLLIEEE